MRAWPAAVWTNSLRNLEILLIRVVQRFRKNTRYQTPSRDLVRLYRQCRQQVREALARWRNPWIVPPLFRVGPVEWAAKYLWFPRLICLNLYDLALLSQVEAQCQDLEQACQLRGVHGQNVFDWEPLLCQLRQRLANRPERLDQEEHPRVAALWTEWISYEQRLLAALEACQLKDLQQKDTHEVETALLSNSEFLSVLCKMARRQLRLLLTHELVHAESYGKSGESKQGDMYLWTGIAYTYNTENDTLYEGVNEAITEWIATRIASVGEETEDTSAWSFFSSPYTDWIIRDLVEVLDAAWEDMETDLPELRSREIQQATDLIYAAYFCGPRDLALLKQALAWLTGDDRAFEKVALACDRLRGDVSIEQPLREESLEDLQRITGNQYQWHP